MERVVLPIKSGCSINNIRDGDIIIYDGTSKEFYITTSDMFFSKYDEKLEKLLERYDSQIEEMKNEISSLKEQMNAFLIQYKETNEKLIAMVESQVTNGGK